MHKTAADRGALSMGMSVTLISDYFFKRFFSFPGWNNSGSEVYIQAKYTDVLQIWTIERVWIYSLLDSTLWIGQWTTAKSKKVGQGMRRWTKNKPWEPFSKQFHWSIVITIHREVSWATKAFWTNLLSKDTKLEPVCPHQQVKVRHLSLRTQYQIWWWCHHAVGPLHSAGVVKAN